jgi:hypothetical protein
LRLLAVGEIATEDERLAAAVGVQQQQLER